MSDKKKPEYQKIAGPDGEPLFVIVPAKAVIASGV